MKLLKARYLPHGKSRCIYVLPLPLGEIGNLVKETR